MTTEGSPRSRLVADLVEAGGERGGFKDMVSVTIDRSRLVAAIEAARAAGFEQLSDIFGIDWLEYPGHQAERFTVAYNLYHLGAGERIFLRVSLSDGDTLPTITHLWKGASFMEREVYDMFGVEFEDHPDLRKLLTPEDLMGHPHRKDFPLGESPTLFNDGRFLDPPTFRAGIMGLDSGLTGWTGGARKGVRSEQGLEITAHESTGEGGES